MYLSFSPQVEPQLRRVDLEVKAGEIVAITGPSGGGKSTLLKALLGLYPQYMGTIRLGGLDLRQLHPAEIRAAVGYVSQQPAFFDDSLAANFRYACPSATDADIIDALAAVGVSLPHPGAPRRPGDPHQRHGRTLAFAGPAVPSLDRARPGQEAQPSCCSTIRATASTGPATPHSWPTSMRSAARPPSSRSPQRPSHMRIADRVIEMRSGSDRRRRTSLRPSFQNRRGSLPLPEHRSRSRTASKHMNMLDPIEEEAMSVTTATQGSPRNTGLADDADRVRRAAGLSRLSPQHACWSRSVVLGALLWAALAPIRELSLARGQLVPVSQVRPVQHLEGGVVEQILVQEGQLVEQGSAPDAPAGP